MNVVKINILLIILGFAPIFLFGGEIFTEDGYAIGGYDPIAYFTEDKPVKGKEDLSYEWKDVRWLFSSEENLKKFSDNPEDYAPQYGGYCAYAVANGYTASTDPDAFSIHEDKLYLNYNALVRIRWGVSKAKFIKSGDVNWIDIQKNLIQE